MTQIYVSVLMMKQPFHFENTGKNTRRSFEYVPHFRKTVNVVKIVRLPIQKRKHFFNYALNWT